jgi:CAP-Gly domain-containing linker protein 1
MTTPAKPRLSSIPTPGRVSAIPTPGSRSRSSSSVYQSKPVHPSNDDISRALADAIRANDPSQHRPLPLSATSSTSSLSPQTLSYSLSSGRRSVAGRPSSAASTSSARISDRAKTPVLTRPASRPPSRQSDASSRLSRTFEVDDNVRIESLGFEGTLRYIGEIDGKPGLWAGVELGGGFAGKGKNNGSVAGYVFLRPNP